MGLTIVPELNRFTERSICCYSKRYSCKLVVVKLGISLTTPCRRNQKLNSEPMVPGGRAHKVAGQKSSPRKRSMIRRRLPPCYSIHPKGSDRQTPFHMRHWSLLASGMRDRRRAAMQDAHGANPGVLWAIGFHARPAAGMEKASAMATRKEGERWALA